MGIGNTLLGDDGVGPYIVRHLVSKTDQVLFLDAGEHPEAAVDFAAGFVPRKTVFLDCADFGGKPGDVRHLEMDTLEANTLSTHRFPVQIVARIIRRDTCGEVYIIGIQASRYPARTADERSCPAER